MALYKIKDFDPNYRDHFEGHDIKGLDLYAADQKIGSVNDVLVDEEGRFRYLIINTGAWIFGKQVMLPIGRTRIDYNDNRVYADGLTKQQVEALPEFTEDLKLDYDHEEQVRNVYRPTAATAMTGLETPVDASTSVDSLTPVDGAAYTGSSMGATPTPEYDRDTYNYDYDEDLYAIDDTKHPSLKLYQERLVASKTRAKTGEVTIGKRVETETTRVSVPVEKERVVIERSTPTSGTVVTPDATAFQEGEVARVEVYEETPDIHKEAFVREEVTVKKVVEQDTVTAEEQIRREELNVDTEGRPVVEGDTAAKRKI